MSEEDEQRRLINLTIDTLSQRIRAGAFSSLFERFIWVVFGILCSWFFGFPHR